MHTTVKKYSSSAAHPFWSIRSLHLSITWEDLCFPQAPIQPAVYFPVSSTTKGCCQQLEAEVVSTGKINHPRSCSSPLYFGDGPLIPPSHKHRMMEKGHSPTQAAAFYQNRSCILQPAEWVLLNVSWERAVHVVPTSWQCHSGGPYRGQEW